MGKRFFSTFGAKFEKKVKQMNQILSVDGKTVFVLFPTPVTLAWSTLPEISASF